MTRVELVRAIDAFGRPEAVFAPPSALFASRAAMKAWDARNPELAAKRFELCGRLVELDREDADQERAATASRAVLRGIKASGLLEREIEASVEPDPTWPGMAAALEWWPTGKTWLVMAGSTGTGKSVAGAWLIRKTLEEGGTAAFKPAAELASTSTYDAGRAELERLKRVRILVVDDFGTENLTDHAGGLLYALFDARHSAKKRTVLTSNLVGKSLTARFGPRIADRIAQDGIARELRGGSKRREGSFSREITQPNQLPNPNPSEPTR